MMRLGSGLMLAAAVAAMVSCGMGCGGAMPTGGDGGASLEPVWREAFDTTGVGAVSAVWGSAPDDVFVVGGVPSLGEVHHYDGDVWRQVSIPSVPILVWVFGFSTSDVYAVGEGGGVIHYDGDAWATLDSGTEEDLWGVWGSATDDLWIVGGDVAFGQPVIIHYDGETFESVPPPENDRGATALFKVWGIGSKLFAVGSNGLIIEYDGRRWSQVETGPAANDDFVSLWGTSESNIVAVGGRATARIAVYDGESWTTQLASGVGGLNGVFMVESDQAVIGGVNGYVGDFDPLANALDAEASGATQTIHAVWGDGDGRFYAVGGRFSDPYTGFVRVRTLESPGGDGPPPEPEPEAGEATLQLGVSNGEPFSLISDGDDVQMFSLGQGGIHFFLSYRVTGFPANAAVEIAIEATLVHDGSEAVEPVTQFDNLTEILPGLNERLDRFVRFDRFPSEIVDRDAILSVTVTSTDDPSIAASTSLQIHLLQPM